MRPACKAASRTASVSTPTTSQPRDANATASGNPIAPQPTSTTCEKFVTTDSPGPRLSLANHPPSGAIIASRCRLPALYFAPRITFTASTTSGGEAKASA